MKKIMFVCLGNICRSPMGKYIFKSLTNDYIVDSAATSTEAVGDSLYYMAKRTLDKYNIPYDEHIAKQLTKEMYDEYDYIVVFEDYNKECVKRLIGDDSKVIKLLPNNIDDPWYTRDFEKAYQDIYQGCVLLKSKLEEL